MLKPYYVCDTGSSYW